MARLTAACVPFLCAAALAQQPAPFVWRELAAADTIAVGLSWTRDLLVEDEEGEGGACGVAIVLAECRLQRARTHVPGLVATALHVDRDVSCVVGVVPAAHEGLAVAFLRALLDDELPMSDDDIALVVARTALAADDAEFLYPGDVQARRAERALGVGPSTAEGVEMAKLQPAAIRDLLRQPVHRSGGGAGAVRPSLRAAVDALPFGRTPDPRSGRTMLFPAPAAGAPTSETHARVDQPFVMAAFRAPDREQWPAFAVALEVARARGARRLPGRGSEGRARTPLVAWSWVAGDRVVRFHRRGTEARRLLPGEQPEADAAAEAAATWHELAAFLDDLRERPPAAAEVQAAKAALVAELGLAVDADRVVVGPFVSGWLLVQMLGPRRGIDAVAIEAVDAAAAHAVLTAAIEPGKGYHHELLPLPRTDRTWPRR